MITIKYDLADEALTALQNLFGGAVEHFNGRPIGVGAITKARWVGHGWVMWSDHFRGSDHSLHVRIMISFDEAKMETLFRLKHPEICG